MSNANAKEEIRDLAGCDERERVLMQIEGVYEVVDDVEGRICLQTWRAVLLYKWEAIYRRRVAPPASLLRRASPRLE